MTSGTNISSEARNIAYFSMEIGLDPSMPTYSGGLGILSGDTLRAAADLGLRIVAVSLLHRNGYFRQHLDTNGNQTESAYDWAPHTLLDSVDKQAQIIIEGRNVNIRAWRYVVKGVRGHEIPVYLLDTRLPDNRPWDQTLTDNLYGGDSRYRLCQETLLGMGGIALLRICPELTPHFYN